VHSTLKMRWKISNFHRDHFLTLTLLLQLHLAMPMPRWPQVAMYELPPVLVIIKVSTMLAGNFLVNNIYAVQFNISCINTLVLSIQIRLGNPLTVLRLRMLMSFNIVKSQQFFCSRKKKFLSMRIP